MSSGNTQRLRYIQHPSKAEMLANSLFRSAVTVPPDAFAVASLADLSSPLQKVVRRLGSDSAGWMAYATRHSVRLFTAEAEFDLSRERGKPVFRLREFTEQGRVVSMDLWVRLAEDDWTRCSL